MLVHPNGLAISPKMPRIATPLRPLESTRNMDRAIVVVAPAARQQRDGRMQPLVNFVTL
jgi:hypothetical protein